MFLFSLYPNLTLGAAPLSRIAITIARSFGDRLLRPLIPTFLRSCRYRVCIESKFIRWGLRLFSGIRFCCFWGAVVIRRFGSWLICRCIHCFVICSWELKLPNTLHLRGVWEAIVIGCEIWRLVIYIPSLRDLLWYVILRIVPGIFCLHICGI